MPRTNARAKATKRARGGQAVRTFTASSSWPALALAANGALALGRPATLRATVVTA